MDDLQFSYIKIKKALTGNKDTIVNLSRVSAEADVRGDFYNVTKKSETSGIVEADMKGALNVNIINGVLDKLDKDDIKLEILSYDNIKSTKITDIGKLEDDNAFEVTTHLTMTTEQYKTIQKMIEENDTSFIRYTISLHDGKAKQYWSTKFSYQAVFGFGMNQLGGEGDALTDLALGGLKDGGIYALKKAGEIAAYKIIGIPTDRELTSSTLDGVTKIQNSISELTTCVEQIREMMNHNMAFSQVMKDAVDHNKYLTNVANYVACEANLRAKFNLLCDITYYDEKGTKYSSYYIYLMEQIEKLKTDNSDTDSSQESIEKYNQMVKYCNDEIRKNFSFGTDKNAKPYIEEVLNLEITFLVRIQLQVGLLYMMHMISTIWLKKG